MPSRRTNALFAAAALAVAAAYSPASLHRSGAPKSPPQTARARPVAVPHNCALTGCLHLPLRSPFASSLAAVGQRAATAASSVLRSADAADAVLPMLQRASRSAAPVMQGGAGMFTASKPADRKVVPDDPGDRTMFKVVYVVLESQYQSSLTAACKRINAGQPDVAVECSGYILEELRDPENFEQFKADVKDANIFIGSLIFVQELADKVEEVVAPERERLDAVCIFPSMPQVMRLNKIGSFSMATMGQSKNVMMDFMKKNKPGGTSFQDSMLKLVRTLPKVLKFLPGDKAKDARAFMMSLQYWLGGSPENIEALLLNLANGYVGEISEGNLLGELEVRAAPSPAGTSARGRARPPR